MDTRTRDSLVLDFVRRRFREAGGEADGDIFIRSVFYLGAGWRRHRLFGNQRVSLSELCRLRDGGATHVQLVNGFQVEDFAIRELLCLRPCW